MTFNFTNWARPFAIRSANPMFRAPGVRPRLIARWRHGSDGRLECRWERVCPTAFLD